MAHSLKYKLSFLQTQDGAGWKFFLMWPFWKFFSSCQCEMMLHLPKWFYKILLWKILIEFWKVKPFEFSKLPTFILTSVLKGFCKVLTVTTLNAADTLIIVTWFLAPYHTHFIVILSPITIFNFILYIMHLVGRASLSHFFCIILGLFHNEYSPSDKQAPKWISPVTTIADRHFWW